jgi:hypothetical protein
MQNLGNLKLSTYISESDLQKKVKELGETLTKNSVFLKDRLYSIRTSSVISTLIFAANFLEFLAITEAQHLRVKSKLLWISEAQ